MIDFFGNIIRMVAIGIGILNFGVLISICVFLWRDDIYCMKGIGLLWDKITAFLIANIVVSMCEIIILLIIYLKNKLIKK